MAKKNSFIAAILEEIAYFGKFSSRFIIDTIYFGGGTPCLLDPIDIKTIIDGVKNRFNLNKRMEISMEINPNSVSESKIYKLKEIGINRLSVGMQSAVEEELEFLGRLHSSAQTRKAVEWAKNSGIENISVDLIIGLKNQTFEKLAKSFEFIKSLNVRHISCYILKIEKDTEFGRNRPNLPASDYVSELYFFTVKRLEEMGFLQYEISNFAKDGYECIHNLKYWTKKPYIGFGPGAHSFFGNRRFFNKPNLDYFLKNPTSFEAEADCFNSLEWLILGLRLKTGIKLSSFRKHGIDLNIVLPRLKKLEQKKLLKLLADRFFLTPRGLMVQNSILLYLIENLE